MNANKDEKVKLDPVNERQFRIYLQKMNTARNMAEAKSYYAKAKYLVEASKRILMK